MTLPLNNTSLQEDIDDNDDENNELYEHFRVVADRGQQLLRVDKFLQDHLPDTSRNRIQLAATSSHSCSTVPAMRTRLRRKTSLSILSMKTANCSLLTNQLVW